MKKNTGKVREFHQREKVGTLYTRQNIAIQIGFSQCHRHTEKTTRPIKLEIRPTFLVPDTNGFIDHLDILQKFAESKIFTIVIPIVGKIFHAFYLPNKSFIQK